MTAPTISFEVDKDFLCPICMQIITDAFLTSCGHSFCYMCILTHLQNKNDCPCCGNPLTTNHIFPNFVLDKVTKKASSHQFMKSASAVEQFRFAVQKGCELSVKDVIIMLGLLSEKKIKMDQEEEERNMQVLMDFLHCLRKLKADELSEVQSDLLHIKADINSVEKHRTELCQIQEKCCGKLGMLAEDCNATGIYLFTEKHGSDVITDSPITREMAASDFQKNNADVQAQVVYHGIQKRNVSGDLDGQHITHPGSAAMMKKRVHAQFNDLQECYLQKRRQFTNKPYHDDKENIPAQIEEGYNAGLADFQSVLTTFTKYSRLKIIAELEHADLFNSANIISSIEFDCDDELFASAGVSRRIKVFDFSMVVNEPSDMNCPVVEMAARSKLSCLSWNRYAKNEIASSDYDGTIILWDVTSHKSVVEYEEHEKRAWTVDFSSISPSMLVSGSDDCKVKVWCTNQERSVLNIDMKANICCVKYNPGSNFHIAVGSADHRIHYFDLRNSSHPLFVFSGHRKAVSYVKFLSQDELASASTDGTLQLWDVNEYVPIRTFRGHTNEKNFVGLSVNGEYLACGSETNEIYIYHKEISRPFMWHAFGSSETNDVEDEAGLYFTSAVCWKDNSTILAANSHGTIKILSLSA